MYNKIKNNLEKETPFFVCEIHNLERNQAPNRLLQYVMLAMC